MKERAAAVVVAFTTAGALAVLCVRGFYVRWFSDDFAVPASVADFGFWRGQAAWYRVWSGRFTFTFVDALLAALGPWTATIAVLLTTVAMVVALHAGLRRWPLALAMTTAILLGTSDVPQSILWVTGLLSYAAPLAAFAWWTGNAARRSEWRWFDAGLPFIAGGCSETEVLSQIVICAMAFAAWRRKPMLAGLIGSLISLFVVALSPGNAVRKSHFAATPPMLHVIAATAADAASFFADAVSRSGLLLILVFLAAALWAPRVSRRAVIVAIVSTIGCAAVSLAAGEVTLVVPLPERARLILFAMIVASVAALGAALPRPERWRSAFAIAVTIAAIVPAIVAIQLARDIPEARAFAGQWDRFEAFLRQNRGRKVFVDNAPGTVGTLVFLEHDPARNTFIRRTYRLQSLAAMPLRRNGRLITGPLPTDAVRYRFE
ncbi:MAG: hypothetical protein JO093_00170 [Acidobacteria bacterium]|nr:hypothetical protein [Acidobacteriota bacterium]MBV9067110.1 hypothetical protein [Acidobacteriota bacterium]MBV9183998.1 hypothetical protein [Acidobacteriota bacterium]